MHLKTLLIITALNSILAAPASTPEMDKSRMSVEEIAMNTNENNNVMPIVPIIVMNKSDVFSLEEASSASYMSEDFGSYYLSSMLPEVEVMVEVEVEKEMDINSIIQ
ncbi:MAG: hypothetical protein EXX96DRAFT_619462 [Benjaminiella poitrasii]|nr:MAG: hypothetical protein EXX96DRAFT_619462 [Benjaminiella poitrasii]